MCYVAHHGTHKFAKNGHHIIRKEQTFRKPVCEETCTLCETLSFHLCGKNRIKSPGGNYVHKCPSRLGYNIKQKNNNYRLESNNDQATTFQATGVHNTIRLSDRTCKLMSLSFFPPQLVPQLSN
jgi:hypothetical protein